MAQGMNNSAACREVGVNRKTGHRWRYGRTIVNSAGDARTYPPIDQAPPVISDRYLSEDERVTIADRLRTGHAIRAIARELGRDASTVSREVRRNADATSGVYHPFRAERRAVARRSRSKEGKLRRDPELRAFVQQHLDQRWSPEQISQLLRRTFADQPELHLAHETIYQALYVEDRGGLQREPTRVLRTGRPRRRPRRRSDQRLNRFARPMVMISERPAEVTDRAVPGHWEGDLIMGTNNRSAIGTLVERTSRFVMLLHLPHGHAAEYVRDALARQTAHLPTHLARSLTWDQGVEMGRHHEFTIASGIPVYFCDPASPWQRGSNENTNGLLRQYFPKGTDLSIHGADDLAAVAAELNARPRKTLHWQTPVDRFAKLVATAN
jgi:IS30 family transposase